MVMALFRGMHRLDQQHLAASIREAKCTHLGDGTRLSRLYTPDPHPISISFSKGQPFSNTGPQARK
jgi:hypothetical protein